MGRDPRSPQDWGTGEAIRVDLHSHSHHSDGLLAPAELVQEAAWRGLRILGLTDHDTVGGLAEATAEGERLGVEVVPGVELSTAGQDGASEVHLLGYFVDPTDPDLLTGLADYAEGRLRRLDRIIERLDALGLAVDPGHVRRLAGPGTVGRPHVARALIELGYAADLAEAFDRYLGAGRPAFVPRPKVDPEHGIALILRSGGVPVLAHPLALSDVEQTLVGLVPVGLAGLEVYYGEYDEADRTALRAMADRWGLIPTGGSDFHGPGFKPGRELGRPQVPSETVTRLRAASGRRGRAPVRS